jgi:predicted esterase
MHRTLLALLALALILPLAGCPPAPDDDDDKVDDDDDATEDPGPQPAELAELSDGECPDFSSTGASTFSSAGLQRTVHTFFPDDPQPGMPVLFFWLSLGTTAQQWIGWFDLDDLAEDREMIVVVPESLEDNMFEWDWVQPDDADAPLYDDLRTCLATELEADMSQVYAAGHSAGGVWTSWLAMHRADTLATVWISSGGLVPNLPYAQPSMQTPMFLMSGGDDDLWTVINFDEAVQNFSEALLADDHFILQCRHDYGHTPPPAGAEMMEDWIRRHDFGEASPWGPEGSRSVEEDFEDYCFIAEW